MKLSTYLQHINSLDEPRVMRFTTSRDLSFIEFLKERKKKADIRVFDGELLRRWSEFSKTFELSYKFSMKLYAHHPVFAFKEMMTSIICASTQDANLIIFKNGSLVLSRETDEKRDIIAHFNAITETCSRTLQNLDTARHPPRPFHVLFHIPKGDKFENIPSIDFSGTEFEQT
jgi:hypothetical protein